MDPPPQPPPHGNNGNNRGGLPNGNYDIFIIPPHSAGSGFLYLPSLQPHRNSFLAGVAVTLLAVAIWIIVFPVLREWLSTIVASGGMGVVILMVGMGVAGWAWGKTQMEGNTGPGGGAGNAGASKSGPTPGAPPPADPPRPTSANTGSSDPPPRPKPTWTRSAPGPGASGGATSSAKTAWEKAREETRKKEEERKRTEEIRKKREEDEKERTRQREREAREREIRELREAREKREREAKAAREADQRAREARERMSAPAGGSRPASPTKGRHQQPTAHTEAEEDAYSFRPYDKPAPYPKSTASKSSGPSSVYSNSYAPSQSTARSTPPPSHRGPYSTKDPDKIVLKAVYSFNNTFMKLPLAQLVSGVGAVTDGLILRITTEGLFIDDDVRGVPQREWDVKAWTMKLVETTEYKSLPLVRASIRDQEGKRYVFILQEGEGWKVAVGLQRLRRGSQVRALGVSGLPMNEARAIVENMGWA